MRAITIRSEPRAHVESGLAARDYIKNSGPGNRTHNRHEDVRENIFGGKAPGCENANRHSRIKVPAGDMAHRIGHRQDGKAKGEGDAEQPDSDLRKRRRQHRAATTAEDEPEGSKEFR